MAKETKRGFCLLSREWFETAAKAGVGDGVQKGVGGRVDCRAQWMVGGGRGKKKKRDSGHGRADTANSEALKKLENGAGQKAGGGKRGLSLLQRYTVTCK